VSNAPFSHPKPNWDAVSLHQNNKPTKAQPNRQQHTTPHHHARQRNSALHFHAKKRAFRSVIPSCGKIASIAATQTNCPRHAVLASFQQKKAIQTTAIDAKETKSAWGVRPSLRKKSRTVAQVMEVVPRRDDESWQRHFEEEQHRQNLQEQANVGSFLSVMA
jgi:hypothetical protein